MIFTVFEGEILMYYVSLPGFIGPPAICYWSLEKKNGVTTSENGYQKCLKEKIPANFNTSDESRSGSG